MDPDPEAREWVWHPTLHVISNLYAYLKVTEADGDVAVTAPIWIAVRYLGGGASLPTVEASSDEGVTMRAGTETASRSTSR